MNKVYHIYNKMSNIFLVLINIFELKLNKWRLIKNKSINHLKNIKFYIKNSIKIYILKIKL